MQLISRLYDIHIDQNTGIFFNFYDVISFLVQLRGTEVNILKLFIFVCFLQILLMYFMGNDIKQLKVVSIFSSVINLIIMLTIYYLFLVTNGGIIMYMLKPFYFQYPINISNWEYLYINFTSYEVHLPLSDTLKLDYLLKIDGLNLPLIVLNYFLILIAVLVSHTRVKYRVKEFYISLQLLGLFVFHVFAAADFLLFYLAFEVILIPMFFIMGGWGTRDRKIHAAYQFFLYTLIGSLVILSGLIYIGLRVGSFNYETLTSFNFSLKEQIFLWICFFFGFGIKMPLIPVHIWLPEAHVEAPTAGSVILAGTLLKIGIYGFLKYSMVLFPLAMIVFQPIGTMIAILGIIYGTVCTIIQTDLKKIIAYSSVSHMSYIFAGLMSCDIAGIEGAYFSCIAHGLVSSGLFIIVGLLYERGNSRIFLYYGGFILVMPILGNILFLMSLSNVGLPTTISFIGEFTVLVGVFSQSILLTLFGLVGLILSAIYTFLLFNRIMFGNLKKENIKNLIDFNLREVLILMGCIVMIFFLGLYPNLILDVIHEPIKDIVERFRK